MIEKHFYRWIYRR